MKLLEETIEALEEHGKSLGDINWIGCESFKITKESFIKLADKEYDGGIGFTKVADDLLLVGYDFWLERHEYDGIEWWEYKEIPKEPSETKEVSQIIDDEREILISNMILEEEEKEL